jgi:hypothetical protein
LSSNSYMHFDSFSGWNFVILKKTLSSFDWIYPESCTCLNNFLGLMKNGEPVVVFCNSAILVCMKNFGFRLIQDLTYVHSPEQIHKNKP